MISQFLKSSLSSFVCMIYMKAMTKQDQGFCGWPEGDISFDISVSDTLLVPSVGEVDD